MDCQGCMTNCSRRAASRPYGARARVLADEARREALKFLLDLPFCRVERDS